MSERIQFLIYEESTEPDHVVFTKNNMLYKRRTILFVFVILFVSYMYSVGFAQSGQGSESSLSESQYIDIIKEILIIPLVGDMPKATDTFRLESYTSKTAAGRAFFQHHLGQWICIS